MVVDMNFIAFWSGVVTMSVVVLFNAVKGWRRSTRGPNGEVVEYDVDDGIPTPKEVRHVTPVAADGEAEHDLNGFCWCQPVYEDVLPNGRIYIHRRSLDAPHIEREGPV